MWLAAPLRWCELPLYAKFRTNSVGLYTNQYSETNTHSKKDGRDEHDRSPLAQIRWLVYVDPLLTDTPLSHRHSYLPTLTIFQSSSFYLLNFDTQTDPETGILLGRLPLALPSAFLYLAHKVNPLDVLANYCWWLVRDKGIPFSWYDFHSMNCSIGDRINQKKWWSQ